MAVYMSSMPREKLPRCATCGVIVHPKDGTALGRLTADGHVLLKFILFRDQVAEGMSEDFRQQLL